MREEMGFNQRTPQLPAEQQEYLTGEQLAELLQVSVKSISRWAISDSSMPVLRIGRTVRFPKERLLRWLKGREQGPGRARQPKKLLTSPLQPLDGQGNRSGEHAVCAQVCAQ